MTNNQNILQQKISSLFNAGIECSLFFKKEHEDEAYYIFGKTINLAAQLYFENLHNPLFGDMTDNVGFGEQCELHLYIDDMPEVVKVSLFELQFDYLSLLLDNLMARIVSCQETRRMLVDTLNTAKLFKYLAIDSSGRPDVVDNTICILLELYCLSDKEKIRDTLVSYLTELDEINSFDEIYGTLKITPERIIDFVYFFEYLEVSGKIEDFLKKV
ncbi:MAG: hypothetical protein Q4F69_00520 [Bacteroidia bacterium]|nr:hypothetical protein [Bacteroidia bacterium]